LDLGRSTKHRVLNIRRLRGYTDVGVADAPQMPRAYKPRGCDYQGRSTDAVNWQEGVIEGQWEITNPDWTTNLEAFNRITGSSNTTEAIAAA
jgi:hypothetical protein